MSSADAFNLDQLRILSFGKEFNVKQRGVAMLHICVAAIGRSWKDYHVYYCDFQRGHVSITSLPRSTEN